MPAEQYIRIGNRTYGVNAEVERYQIPFGELGDLRVNQIPPHSHIEILGLATPTEGDQANVYGLNAGDSGSNEHLQVYGGISLPVPEGQRNRVLLRLRRAFPEIETDGFLPNPHITTHRTTNGTIAHVHLNLNFKDAPETLLKDALVPFVEGFRRLARPSVYVFVCYASEDKSTAQQISVELTALGAAIWFDEWEIRIGDSIVQRIDAALGRITHLVVLLSRSSVNKPWVNKELSVALMRQLTQKSVTVLPLRLDDCAMPPILADIKYADARKGLRQACDDLAAALFEDGEQKEPNQSEEHYVSPGSDAG